LGAWITNEAFWTLFAFMHGELEFPKGRTVALGISFGALAGHMDYNGPPYTHGSLCALDIVA